jgi:indolepyruvate ferredoxin oxidoreductase
MAAHLEGRGLSALDMAGLAQKGGAVTSHVRLAPTPDALHATRIAIGEADLVIGCDVIVTGSGDALARMQPGRTRVVINTAESPTAAFVSDPDWQSGSAHLVARVRATVGSDADLDLVDAQGLATALMGDAIYTNPFMLGYAWQKGWIPLARDTLRRAIELNGVAAVANLQAWEWGRAAAHDPEAVRRTAHPVHPPQGGAQVIELKRATALEELVARRVAFLTDYQDAAYAQRYAGLVERVRRAESDRLGSARLAEAVARYYFKLLAIKDEYEVARLHRDAAFHAGIAAQFEGDYRLNFWLAPPLFARPDPITGVPRKVRFGSWMLPVFGVLARLRFLRGTAMNCWAG